jgi:hypothetical protein
MCGTPPAPEFVATVQDSAQHYVMSNSIRYQ